MGTNHSSTCASGVLEALQECGDALVEALAKDIIASDGSWMRCSALMALAGLMQRDDRCSRDSVCELPLHVPQSTPCRCCVLFRCDLCGRSRWLNKLRAEGYVRHFVASLVDIDVYESESLAAVAGDDWTNGGTMSLEPEVVFDSFNRSKSRRGGPLNGLEAIEVRERPVVRGADSLALT